MRDVIDSLESHARTKTRVQDISPKQSPPRTKKGLRHLYPTLGIQTTTLTKRRHPN